MKILIIRFSSIGDIVLTTPVIRCLKNQLSAAEVHYLTKPAFRPVLGMGPPPVVEASDLGRQEDRRFRHRLLVDPVDPGKGKVARHRGSHLCALAAPEPFCNFWCARRNPSLGRSGLRADACQPWLQRR